MNYSHLITFHVVRRVVLIINFLIAIEIASLAQSVRSRLIPRWNTNELQVQRDLFYLFGIGNSMYSG